MKKIALIVILLAACVAAARAQESRMDVSLSGTVLIEHYVQSPTDTDVSANRALGALASYRFMLTPSSAVEANYGVTYRNNIHYVISNTNHYLVPTRTQEATFAYVRSFTYRKFNPFVEAGAGGLIFLPIRDSELTTLDAQQQTEISGLFGGGFAYEISPSFDIRAEYRGLICRVPTFKDTVDQLGTNKWYQIYNPVIGVAYHF
jgi:outer membrane immunogenic protein